MLKNIARLHFITHPSSPSVALKQIKEVLAGGCNWVQLRMKGASDDDFIEIGRKALPFCMEHGAKLIINDKVQIANAIGADGVHLGKEDMSPLQAREILGPQAIIGATANTFEDIQQLSQQPVDYIGLGPFRFTSTKEKLSPQLGIDGYKHIIEQCQNANIYLPIIAIGGIVKDDFEPLFKSGIYGIAMSSSIINSENPGLTTLDYLTRIGECSSANWKHQFKHQ